MEDGFVLTRALPLILEHNIGKISKKLQDKLIVDIVTCLDTYNKDGKIDILEETKHPNKLVRVFIAELKVGNQLFVTQNLPEGKGVSSRRGNIENDVRHVIPKAIALALNYLSKEEAKWLTFFFHYGLLKWGKDNRPGPISATYQTWNFKDIDGMLLEFSELKKKFNIETKPAS
jgi:hypothetical protein